MAELKCKTCKHFIQGIGHRGTCEKKPFVTDRRGGGVRYIKDEPQPLIVSWSRLACKMYERGCDNG
jgi:hypothetical protein